MGENKKAFAVITADGKRYKIFATCELNARILLCEHLGISFADKYFGIEKMKSYEIKEENDGN